MKLYGNLTNRFQEGHNFTGREIREGDDITEYLWSDRVCYFITKVVDQKHIFIHRYRVVADQDKAGGMGHQNWLYFKTNKEANDYMKKYYPDQYGDTVYEDSDIELVFRYNHWNRVYRKNWNGEDYDKPRYNRMDHISFGVRDYYYDWEF